MKKRFLYLFVCITCFNNSLIFAQNETDSTKLPVFKVAVFSPLYLDSVFTDNKLRNDKSLPKFIMPSVEFVQGAEIAFDTLLLHNEQVEAFIYDTKSFTEPLPQLLRSKKLDSVNLIIGSVRDIDFKQLADFSLSKNIPFVSATFPNDGGVTANPFLTIMNSTLKAHCEGIYSYILQNHGTDKIYLFKKAGAQEDKIAGIFKAINEQEGKPFLNIQTITFDSTFSAFAFKKKLDSTQKSIIIGGSLNEDFAKNLADLCFGLKKKYPVILMGMPNWDGFKIFAKEDSYKDFPVYFTSPYYNPKTNTLSNILTDEYNRRYKSKPSDIACKGFETAYYFTRLLMRYPDNFMAHLNDSSFKVFNDYNFRAVLPKKTSTVPDYFENKHLYVMKILNGVVVREW